MNTGLAEGTSLTLVPATELQTPFGEPCSLVPVEHWALAGSCLVSNQTMGQSNSKSVYSMLSGCSSPGFQTGVFPSPTWKCQKLKLGPFSYKGCVLSLNCDPSPRYLPFCCLSLTLTSVQGDQNWIQPSFLL